jgi:ABC-type oligopeptide transport system ATPase subunit
MPLPIIHINGFPGTGKLTIARKLVALLAPYSGKLVHNHLLIDPAGAILPRTSADYQSLRRAIRTAVFDTLATSQDTFDSVFVFTDFQSDSDIGSAVMAEYRDMAARRGCAFIPIVVTCSKEENLRRLASLERSQHEKLTDIELAARIRDNSVIHQSPDDRFRMELDLTELGADAAASMIHGHILEVLKDTVAS